MMIRFACSAIVALAGAPAAAISRINAALNDALRQSAPVKTLHARGADAVGGSVADFARVVKAGDAKRARVVKASGAKVE